MVSLSSLWANRKGTAVLEFAIVAPMFMMMLFSMLAYGIYLSTGHAVQQIAADAARTAIAGLTPVERLKLASDFVDASTLDYAFVTKDRIAVKLKDDTQNLNQFTVTIAYDARELPIWNLFSYALPDKTITRFATIRLGGL